MNSNSNNNNKQLPSMIRGVGHNNAQQSVMHRGLSIRGASYGASSSFGSPMGSSMGGGNIHGINIRGESGPATVVISNLDPSANAEDIRVREDRKRRRSDTHTHVR